MLQRLKGLFFDNFLIKLFSLIFATALWLHVVTKGKSEVNMMAPLELKDLPQNMVVVSELPPYVDVRLSGQENVVRNLTARDVGASISLKDAEEGETMVYLSPSNIKAPSNITITQVSPVEIRLRLDTMGQRQLHVAPVLTGEPGRGFRVVSVRTDPDTVVVTGPKRAIDKVGGVKTVPVNIEGVTGGFESTAMIEPPSARGAKLDVDSVKVVVSVAGADKGKGARLK